MPSQVFLFQDSELTQPAAGILLPPRNITTIYICLQPSKKRLNKIYADGTCRDIVGGIRIKAIEADSPYASAEALLSEEKSLVPTYEETIKFTAVLGKSVLSVSRHSLDLGRRTSLSSTPVKGNTCVPKRNGNAITGQLVLSPACFELSNMSSRLPLEWFIPTPKLFVRSPLTNIINHLTPTAVTATKPTPWPSQTSVKSCLHDG